MSVRSGLIFVVEDYCINVCEVSDVGVCSCSVNNSICGPPDQCNYKNTLVQSYNLIKPCLLYKTQHYLNTANCPLSSLKV